MKKIILLIIVGGLVFTQSPKVLTIEDFLNVALTTHPLMAKTKAEYFSQLKSIESVNGINDWNLFLSTSYTKGYGVQGTTLYNSESEIYQINGGTSALLADTGTRLSIASNTLLMRKIPSFLGGVSNVYSTNLNLSISQPILRNAFGKLDRHPLVLALYSTELTDLKYSEDIEDFYKTLVDEYLSWQLAYTTLKITKEQLSKAKEQVDLVSQQYNKGVSEKIDLIQAKQNLKAKSIQNLSANQDYTNKLLIINSRMGSIDIDNQSLLPQTNIMLTLGISKEESILHIKQNSSLSKTLKLQEKIQEATLAYKKDQIQPSAELFLTKTLGTAVDNSSTLISNFGTQAPLTFGIKMETGLNNTLVDKELQSADFALKKTKKQTEEILKYSIDGITTIFDNIEKLDMIIAETEELLALSKEHADLEEKRYKQGRSSLYFVIVAQDQLLNIKLQLESLKTTKSMLLNQLASQLDSYQNIPLIKSIINTNKGDK